MNPTEKIKALEEKVRSGEEMMKEVRHKLNLLKKLPSDHGVDQKVASHLENVLNDLSKGIESIRKEILDIKAEVGVYLN
jgi:predicted  nucleic acid-binding Zn-ribbon protein